MPKPKQQKTVSEIADDLVDKTPEPKISAEPILYDARVPQSFEFNLVQNRRLIPIKHTLELPSDERWIRYSEHLERLTDDSKSIEAAMYQPQSELWDDCAIEVSGYQQTADWKRKVSPDDKLGVINAMLQVDLDEEPLEEADGEELVYEFDAVQEIFFVCRFGPAKLFGMVHKYREPTQAEMAEFLSIQFNQPSAKQLASAVKRSKVERVMRLANAMYRGAEGYAEGSPVPAYHKAATLMWHCYRQMSRQGKF